MTDFVINKSTVNCWWYLRDERPLLLDELQISSSNIGAQGGGVDTLKHLLGLFASNHQMSLQRREGACGDVQDHHGAGPGETPPQLGRHGEIRPPDLMLEGGKGKKGKLGGKGHAGKNGKSNGASDRGRSPGGGKDNPCWYHFK